MQIEKQRLVWIYRTMLTIRRFEEKALALFEGNLLRGSVHLYIGEEAIAATVCSLLKETDYITSTHRGHGHCIAKGADIGKTLAELMGRETGYCKGRGGSMHIADTTKGNLGANAIVGAGIPIATGAALSAVLRNSGQVAVSFFGDGASNQGVFHEALNLGALWKLPVVYVCENNGFGISVPVERSTSVADISQRAASYQIPGVTVDGNDTFEVDRAARAAIERARKGEGPTLIECKTYRWKGHWTGDPEVYRTKSDVDAWKNKCPIKRLEAHLLKEKLMSADEMKQMAAEVCTLIDGAERFARESPEPEQSHVLDDVYFDGK